MKIFKVIVLFVLFQAFLAGTAAAQKRTIILVRHAEKDASANMNRFDPDLSDEGRGRAVRLFEIVKEYKPVQIFSTNLRRTRFTAEPSAVNLNEKYRIWVEAYNPGELSQFAERLLALKTRSILVVGHSNTTPALANLLIKQEKYKELPDSVYGKIYIIEIDGKKVEDRVIEY
jgi:2,3-bisphosphoglycerate-dependent phosphoglycerate mutase